MRWIKKLSEQTIGHEIRNRNKQDEYARKWFRRLIKHCGRNYVDVFWVGCARWTGPNLASTSGWLDPCLEERLNFIFADAYLGSLGS